VAQIVVTADELDSVASQLAQGADQVMQQFNLLKGKLDGLVSSGWQGSASAAYQNTYDEWNKGATQVQQALESLATMLKGAATTYRSTEEALTNQLKS
jgi:WXG100 family type VII secretion target